MAKRVLGLWPLPILAVIGLLTAAAYLTERKAVFDLLAQGLLQTATLTVAAMLVFVLARRRWAALLTALALVAQLGVLQPRLMPARAASHQPMAVRVIFSNIWAANTRIDEVLETIAAQNPDVVVLAEIWLQAHPLLDRLSADYPHRADCRRFGSCDTAILSRLPILEDRSTWDWRTHGYVASALIETAAGPIEIAGTHLSQPLPLGRVRRQQQEIGTVVDALKARSEPILLVGDFNAVPWGRVIRHIATAAELEPAHGLEGTWHSALPWPLRLPIDHAFTGRGLALLDRTVIDMPGSDHKALRLDVGITTP